MVIILLNNVIADMENTAAQHGFFDNQSRGNPIVPSLGLMWSNCINERIALRKKGQQTANQDVKRTMAIEKSAYMRKNEIDFVIVASGLRGKH